MRTGLPDGPPVDEIIILRALNGIGDLMCLVPALRSLRRGLPEARITLLGTEPGRAFVARFNHCVDAFIAFPGFPGIPEKDPEISLLPARVSAIQARGFDLALQMQGNGLVSNSFIGLLGSRRVAGFYLPGQYCPDPRHFLPYPAHLPEIHRHLALMKHLGMPSAGDELEFPLMDRDWEELSAIPETRGFEPQGYVCIHPGATAPSRRWSPTRFGVVADWLAEEGYLVVVTGTAAERHLAQAVMRRMRSWALDLTGRTSLGTLAALLSHSALVVTNDTGVAHVCDGLHVPSVVIFAGTRRTGSDPLRWGPLDRELHRVVAREPCAEEREPEIELHCLRDRCRDFGLAEGPEPPEVHVEAVIQAASGLLRKEKVHAF